VKNLCHINAVLCTTLLGNSAKVWFITQSHMGINHIEMTLADRNVSGFRYHQAAVVKIRMHMRQLDQLLKIFKCGVTSTIFEIAYKGRSIDRCEDLVVTTNGD